MTFPTDPGERSKEIQRRLRERGWTFAKIARELDYNICSVAPVARERTSQTVEAAIAAAIGVEPNEIWPERYGPDRVSRHRFGARKVSDWNYRRIRKKLKAVGLTFAEIGRQANCCGGLVTKVCQGHSRSQRVEAVIASNLGVEPRDLWPERYPELLQAGSTAEPGPASV